MEQGMHTFPMNLRWEGSTATEYTKDAVASAPGKADIALSASSSYGGTDDKWNPEDLFGASMAYCHMLTFLALAKKVRLDVRRYEDSGLVTLDSVDAANPGDPRAAPRGPLEITSAIGLAGDDAHGPWSSSIGLAGTEVGAVVIELRDGTRVVASLANGMWAASWPGRHVEVRILVYDGTGDVAS